MNYINSFINQQIGSSIFRNYDIGISRLVCRKDEEFKWLFPEHAMEGVVDTPIFACKFAQVKGYEHILALANEDGKIAIYNTETGGPRLGGEAHNNAIFDLAWMPKGMKLVSASGDHTAALYDFRDGDIELEQVFQGHTRSLKTVSCRVNDFCVFATGGRDGKIIIWDSRAAKSDVLYCAPDICLPYTHHHPSQVRKVRSKNGKIQPVISGSSSVTGLVFQDYYTLISCGAGDGLIKVWDLRKNYYISDRAAIPKYSIPYTGNTLRNGFSNLLLNSNGTKLYANCLDNVIYCYNVATYQPEPVMKYYGHKNSTFYVKSSLSSDEIYLLSGSSDNNAYIWNTAYSEPIVRLESHEAEVTCVAWCARSDDTVLVTCSDDLRHKIWRIGVDVIPKEREREFSSKAKAEVRDSDDSSQRNSHKRALECDENLYPFETSRRNGEKFRPYGHKCGHVTCTKVYHDEFLMVSRNHEMQEKCKRLKTEGCCKRKHLNNVDLNVATTSTCRHDDEVVHVKRFKFDYDFNTTEDEDDDDDDVEDSPTTNLPNFIVDGSAPHLNSSPVKKKEKDWLTKLRMERMSTSEIQELSKPSSPKVQKTDDKSSLSKNATNSSNSPSHKTGNKSQDNTNTRTQSPLLKYFKVTNNPGQQYTSKSSNLVSSPKSQSSQEK